MRRPVEPEATGFGEFLQRHPVKPADIQRDYIWTGVQVAALVDDLLTYLDRKNSNIASPGYFIGSFVGYRDGDGVLRLYDGLQRTTTLTLLMCVVRDLLGDEPLADALHECVEDKGGVPRFALEGEDETLATRIQPRGATRHWSRKEKVLNRFIVIAEARQTILGEFIDRGLIDNRGALQAGGRSRLRGLAAVLVNDVYLVHLRAEDEAIGLRMFETVNMRGVAMDDVDLIKTRLPAMTEDPAEVEALLASWDRLRGRVRFQFREFLLAIDAIYRNWGAEPQSAPFERLTEWMAEKQAEHPQALRAWMAELIEYAEGWNEIHAVQRKSWNGSPALKPLRPIWVIDWFEWKPYALDLVRHWQRERASLKAQQKRVSPLNNWLAEHLDQLQRACMALDVAQDGPSQRREFFYGARKGFAQDQNAARFLPPVRPPRQRRIRNTLSGPLEDRSLRLRLLTWLEATQDPDAIGVLLENGASTPTVEHILPQNPKPGSEWFSLFPDEVTVRRSRNLLGNLALIPSRLNTRMDNKRYADKRAMAIAALTTKKGYTTAVSAFGEPVWDQAAIDRRTQALGEAVWRALKLDQAPPVFTPGDEVDPPEDALD